MESNEVVVEVKCNFNKAGIKKDFRTIKKMMKCGKYKFGVFVLILSLIHISVRSGSRQAGVSRHPAGAVPEPYSGHSWRCLLYTSRCV